MAGDSNGDSNGDWKVVTRKKPYPTQWRISQQTETQSKPYLPYTKPTYAQILRRSSPAPTMTSHGRTSPPTSQPPSPTSQATTIYYVSPHSPSRLRFPPSHTFPEWRGRCFRCCRTGHSAAKCRNPKRCGSLPPELRRFAGDDRMDLNITRMVTHSMQAGNPADRAAETQHPSQTVQTVPLQSLDRIQPPPTEFDVAGHSGISPTQHDSQRNSRCLIQSKQPMPANPRNRGADPCDNYEAGLAVATLLQNNSCQKPPAASGPKPHRILSRGEPSKNVSAAVSVRADGAESVQKETEILSPFEEHAKTLEVSKTDANSAKAQQKNRAQSTNTRPKLKPLRQGPLCIAPQSRKFKWTRPTPSNNAQVTKKLIAAASNKRKIVPSQAPGNPKRPVKGKEKQQAELSFNPEGFYEVQVHYDHISKLATGCGFTHKDVEEVIKIDNAQRQLASRTTTSADTMQTEEEPDLSRFEPDSSDELTSDEEEA
ncbi:hypothetical protein FCM35_KLT14749 [Carex littledalei]|uniref:CCHC-type domain-containing protein n=1 Tax=Carex littledalei TaxID=544730 RepID=A0A833QAB5_9POAL|nr:hypothetical protein FCM35_KLT14749 [Carex littledalei]